MANSGQSSIIGDNNVSTGITTPDQHGPPGRSTVCVAWDAISSLGRHARVDSHESNECTDCSLELGSLDDVVGHAQQEENYYSGSQESLGGNPPSRIRDRTCNVNKNSRQLKRDRPSSPRWIQNQAAHTANAGPKHQIQMAVGSPPSYGVHDYQDDTYIQAHNAPSPSPVPEPEPESTLSQDLQNFTFNQPPTITIPSSLHMTPIVRRSRRCRPRIRVRPNAPPNFGSGPHLSGLFRPLRQTAITITTTTAQFPPPIYNVSPPVSPKSSPRLRPANSSPYPSCPPTPRLQPIEAWLAGLESPGSTTASGRHILSGPGTDEDGGSEKGDRDGEEEGERMVFRMSPIPPRDSGAASAELSSLLDVGGRQAYSNRPTSDFSSGLNFDTIRRRGSTHFENSRGSRAREIGIERGLRQRQQRQRVNRGQRREREHVVAVSAPARISGSPVVRR